MHPIENCPKCGSKMEKGYIITLRIGSVDDHLPRNHPIVWNKSRIKLFSFTHFAPARIYKSYSEAYRCQNCKLILLHYGEEETE